MKSEMSKKTHESSPSPPRGRTDSRAANDKSNVQWYKKNPTWRKLQKIEKDLEKVFTEQYKYQNFLVKMRKDL